MLDRPYEDDQVGERPELLSSREREVMDNTMLGLTNAETAKRLGVTVHAVKFHLARIYRKLGAANRTEAAFLYQIAQTAGKSRPAAETSKDDQSSGAADRVAS